MDIVLDAGSFTWIITIMCISVCLVFLLVGIIWGSLSTLNKQKRVAETVFKRLEKGFKTVKKLRRIANEEDETEKGVSDDEIKQ